MLVANSRVLPSVHGNSLSMGVTWRYSVHVWREADADASYLYCPDTRFQRNLFTPTGQPKTLSTAIAFQFGRNRAWSNSSVDSNLERTLVRNDQVFLIRYPIQPGSDPLSLTLSRICPR